MAKTDYYEVLGVGKGATQEEIKSAYRKQAVKWHPDKHQGGDKETAEKKFKEINEAYQILSDANKRASYDQFGASGSPAGGGFSGGNPFGGFGGNPFTYTYSTNSGGFGGADFGDPFEIFEQFFGGSSPFTRTQRLPRYTMSISFEDAYHGFEKEVSIEGKKRKIKIPAGVNDGSRIQFNDFILSINVKPSSIYERDGADLYVNVQVSYSLLSLGGDIEVPTMEGEIKIKVRGGTQPGSLVRIKDYGFPHLQSRGKGDLYIRVNVQVPKKLSRRQKSLLHELQEEGL